MADELVYRIVLDGSEEKSRPDQPAQQRQPVQQAGSRPSEFEPVVLAQKRLQMEREALLVDQQVRALKEKKSLEQVQKEDSQAAAEARDPYAIAKRLSQRREEAEQIRLAGLANQSGSTIEQERLREASERVQADAQKAKAEAEKTRAEAERERARIQRERETTDPRAAAEKRLRDEQFAERARLELAGLKSGMTPQEVLAKEEREKAQKRAEEARDEVAAQRKAFAQKVGFGAETAGAIAGGAVRGNVFGVAGALAGSIHPVGAAVVAAVGEVAGAMKGVSDQVRQESQKISRFSPELSIANARNRIASTIQDIGLAQKYGAQQAEHEQKMAFYERLAKDQNFRLAQSGNAWAEEWEIFKAGLRGIAANPGAIIDEYKKAGKELLAWLIGELPNAKAIGQAVAKEVGKQAPPKFDIFKDIIPPYLFQANLVNQNPIPARAARRSPQALNPAIIPPPAGMKQP